MVTVRAVTPGPLTVIVAVREVAPPILAVTVTVTVPLLLPVAGATVAHVWLLATVQPVTFDVTLNVCEPAALEKVSAEVETLSVDAGVAPSCVMVTVRAVTPGPLTVIVAVRDAAPVLAVTVTVTVPLLFPVAGETVAHVWLLATVQPVTFDVTLNVCEPAALEKSSVLVDTLSVDAGVAPSCVMVTVRDVTPGPLTVIVAVREVAPVLAVTVTVTVPLLFPVAGATVAHVWLLATVQPVTFDVTLNVCEPASLEKSSAEVDTLSVDAGAVPACVMVTVRAVTPDPLTVIVAVRDAAPVLAVTVTVTVALLFPVAGATVAHAWLLATVQPVTFDVTLKVCEPAALEKSSAAVDTLSVGTIGSLTVIENSCV